MFLKKIKFIFIIFLLYQTPLNSKSTTFINFDSNNLSKYFSSHAAYMKKSFGLITKNQFSVDINFQDDLDYLNFLIKR